MYIQMENDFPQYHKPQGDIMGKKSKEDRVNLFQKNLTVMDQTFKVFDIMFKHKYKGMVEVDADMVEDACLADYQMILRRNFLEAQARTFEHMGNWEASQRQWQEEVEKREHEEKMKKEEEEKEKRINQMRGVSQMVPILSEEEEIKKFKDEEMKKAMMKRLREAEEEEMRRRKDQYEQQLKVLKQKEEHRKNQLNDPMVRADPELFRDFLIMEGVQPDNYNLIDSLYQAYSEKDPRQRETKRPRNFNDLAKNIEAVIEVANKEPTVPMKTFLLNYKRYLSDKFKKKDMTSPKKAKDLNSLLRTYLTEWKTGFPKFTLAKMGRASEEEKRAALMNLLPFEIATQVSRKDLETFNYLLLMDQYKYVDLKIKEFNNCPFNTIKLQQKYEAICSNLPVASSSLGRPLQKETSN